MITLFISFPPLTGMVTGQAANENAVGDQVSLKTA
jgi:hypothetical protein